MAKGNGSWLTRSYNFRDRDPEIDKFRTLFQDERGKSRFSLKEDDLAALAGLSTSTIKSMFGGKTRKPQHATFAKMAAALGHSYSLTRDLTPNYEVEVPKAKEQRTEYRAMLRKQREREERRRGKKHGKAQS